ncbi:MAG TPA: hypothetical protein VJV23_07790 [Candidatus Polarisedimenticolia bacterium]|nr:hypothetical protein [Candidatus Polarisedimenticolia bacterium]
MEGRSIRAGFAISMLAFAGLFDQGPIQRKTLHNEGDLALVDAAIDAAVHSPAGTSITVVGEVIFNGPFRGGAPFNGRGTAVFNDGCSPGDSPAVVPFEGGVRFGPASALTIELGATTFGSFDRLEIQAGLEAGGALVVVLLPGFAGNPGDSYEIATAAGITGSFTYTPPNVGQGVTLALQQTSTSIRLTVAADCNGNNIADADEVAQNPAQDCDGNLIPDSCDISGGASDTNANGYLDTCEVCLLDVAAAGLSWTPLVVAAAYDVVAGDLGTLHVTGGDFTAATAACLSDNQPGTALPYTTDPSPGNGIWFLVRGVAGPVNLSLDTFGPSQVGSRDAEVAASAAACP